MRIRPLKEIDAEWMLEWMHDADLVRDLFADFSRKKIADCKEFINKSLTDSNNLNLAITDEQDIYMGTVSLKHIDLYYGNAEFAIAMRRVALGRGYSIYGMNEMLKKAQNDLKLNEIYWCVSKKNTRAIRFYDKNKFKLCTNIPSNIAKYYPPDIRYDFVWYCVQF